MSKGLILLDSSVLCEILQIPGKSHTESLVPQKFTEILASNDYLIYLPMATVIETGNHIAQAKLTDGNIRRLIAQKFIGMVKMAIEGTTPFKTLAWEAKEMMTWLSEFPDYASRSQGFGDLSIIHQFNRFCEDSPSQLPITIWSADGHLTSYSRNWEVEL